MFLENCIQCFYTLLLKFMISGLHALSWGGAEGLQQYTEQPGGRRSPVSSSVCPGLEVGGCGAPTKKYWKP